MLRSTILGLAVSQVGAAPLLTVTDGGCTIDAQGCMLSENYPNPYPSGKQCTITPALEVKALRVDDFETEFTHDGIRIGDNFWTGSKVPPITLKPQGGTLQWTSSAAGVSSGWQICPNAKFAGSPMKWTVTGPCSLCPTTKCISSPNFPLPYGNNEVCTITYPANNGGLMVTHFQVEKNDKLGTWTGGIPDTITIPDDKRVMQFFADGDTSRKGFKLCPLTVVPAAPKAGVACPVAAKPPINNVPLESMPLNVNNPGPAVGAIGGHYSIGDGAVDTSSSSVLIGVAAVAAVAGVSAGWVVSRRCAATDVAHADRRALTLDADAIEAGTEENLVQ